MRGAAFRSQGDRVVLLSADGADDADEYRCCSIGRRCIPPSGGTSLAPAGPEQYAPATAAL